MILDFYLQSYIRCLSDGLQIYSKVGDEFKTFLYLNSSPLLCQKSSFTKLIIKFLGENYTDLSNETEHAYSPLGNDH